MLPAGKGKVILKELNLVAYRFVGDLKVEISVNGKVNVDSVMRHFSIVFNCKLCIITITFFLINLSCIMLACACDCVLFLRVGSPFEAALSTSWVKGSETSLFTPQSPLYVGGATSHCGFIGDIFEV